MILRHKDIDIPSENPFQNCKLDRKKYAEILMQIVSSYADGFVLAVNNEWGAGKSTFLKMSKQMFINNGFKTVFFNAWENDFNDDPMVAIMAELKSLNPSKKAAFSNLVKKATIISKKVLPALAKGIAKKYIDTDLLVDAIEKTSEGAMDILEMEIDEYDKKKNGVNAFKKDLEKFVAGQNAGMPLLFIIDELDRCRPDYAVSILEQIKHFFSVPGIVFILSIDKIQLGHAIRGVYGSEQLNAEEYLSRFIDVEYSIPVPSTKNFCQYLYNYYNFNEFINSDNRQRHSVFSNDQSDIIDFSHFLFEKWNLSLRRQSKLFAYARLVLTGYNSNSYIFPTLLISLICMKYIKPELYTNIKNYSLSLEELFAELQGFFPKNEQRHNRNNSATQALLIVFYNNGRFDKTNLVEKDNDGKLKINISLPLMPKEQSIFARMIDDHQRNFDYGGMELGKLLSKIDLTENISL